jgi:hypothetical protein
MIALGLHTMHPWPNYSDCYLQKWRNEYEVKNISEWCEGVIFKN